ncbi:hypothetical protein Ahy_B06g084538 [Arachis hypogaea]|uniref:Uncharacterized protein n=1 Tax=Arachis hypogaea TaxID=3818 RepID=A0A444YS79_ARAHY|nr:hypothetical protein Ahy_B06g084538 [Arachis hypogaea]
MEISTPEGGSNSTLITSNEGNEELSVGEVVTQEGSKVDEITDVMVTRKDELELRHEFSNHSGIIEEEIPVIGMCFDSLPLARKFYANYAKKVGFVTKFRNTNFDKTYKESKIHINQSIHYTREGYREYRVKAATQANIITATRCRARMYFMLDREKESWIVSRLELRHSHPSSAKKAVHYHEYRELTMHAKCVITDNNEAGIRPNNTYLALTNAVGGSSNLSFSEKNVRNYITSKLRCADDNADFKEMMNYFVRMKEINPNFFYAIDVDDANKHGLLFAFFVGVNHNGKSTILGCALLGSEEIPSFEWVFMQWVRCAGTAPRRIITDQYKAMVGAIRKSGLVQFVYEYDNVLGNKEQKELEDDAADSKGVIPCIGSTGIGRQFQRKYTSNMFRDVQLEVRKKIDCVVRSTKQQGNSISIKVDEQKIVWEKTVYRTFTVDFDPLSQEV